LYGKSGVESWIASANRVGIRVHIWMQAFYDGSWINPVSGGSYNTQVFNSKIAEAKEYANLKGVSGILFDYLRYPGTAYKTSGGAAAISEFTRQATQAIHNINPNILVSAALMPEPSVSVYYYGQDYSKLSSYLDLVLPMVYKGNYKSGTSWISSTTKWYVDNSKGAKVWTTLQSYRSDDDPTKLPISELNNDIKTVLNAKASGVILFRYGLSNIPNFNNLK
ncbi:putative glycoside hydrolase, partial [Methanobrevibacter sp.]|uniref:putative glycoside hydrolase n=1 Tax=Methanobrevibacter sp. TaxID=66852 RepID=UPI00386761B8